MKKKILILGSSGLLGTGFKNIEKKYGKKYRFIYSSSSKCDLTKFEKVKNYLRKIKPDFIVNCAANVGGMKYINEKPASVLRDNLLINLNLLEACRSIKVKKIVLLLSCGMYPEKVKKFPIKEEYLNQGEPVNYGFGSYAYAKRIINTAIKSYRFQYKLNVIGLSPNGMYGENLDWFTSDKFFINSIMKRFITQKNQKNKIIIWGDGKPMRELTHCSDMARCIIWSIEKYDSDEFLNIGTSEINSIKKITYLIAKTLNISKKRILFDKSKPNGVLKKPIDNSKFLKLSKFKFISLESGLKKNINWISKHYK
jgi:GDP-L-fucose synthase